MTQRKPSHRLPPANRTPPVSVRAPRRTSWTGCSLIVATLLLIAIGAATMIFWYAVMTTELLIVNDSVLYFIRNVGLLGLLFGALGLFISISAFRRAALPTADLLEATERAATGDYNLTVEERGPREIRALSRAFNELLAHIRTHDQSHRRLHATVAREVQMQLDIFAASPEDDHLDRLARLVRDWNTLAMAENNRLVLYPKATDLAALVRNTLSGLHSEASARGVALRVEVPDPDPVIQADPTRIVQVLMHIVIYMLAHSTAGNVIQVNVSELRKPRGLQVTVNDQRNVISPEELPYLFTQMAQPDSISTGLELPLAQQLMHAHNGKIIATSEAERGTSIIFFLPFN